MQTFLRHLLSILVLPVTVTVIVPRWLQRADLPVPASLPATSPARLVTMIVAIMLFAAGIALFAWCVALFAREGKGTLAPWDPTRRLVVRGPYRYMRNPMISAVATILAAEALLLHSPRIAAWLAVFLAVNQAYFLAVEEPGLERRFGEEYREYRRAVPRWIPRAHRAAAPATPGPAPGAPPPPAPPR